MGMILPFPSPMLMAAPRASLPPPAFVGKVSGATTSALNFTSGLTGGLASGVDEDDLILRTSCRAFNKSMSPVDGYAEVLSHLAAGHGGGWYFLTWWKRAGSSEADPITGENGYQLAQVWRGAQIGESMPITPWYTGTAGTSFTLPAVALTVPNSRAAAILYCREQQTEMSDLHNGGVTERDERSNQSFNNLIAFDSASGWAQKDSTVASTIGVGLAYTLIPWAA